MENIKTLTCPNCGAHITNLQNCEYCGSLLIRLQQQGISIENSDYKNNDKVFEGLIEALQENIQLQKQNPKIMTATYVASTEYYEEYYEETDSALSISNYILSVRDGSELSSSSNDGKPHLMVEFSFSEFGKNDVQLLNKFRSLDFLNLFTYYIDKNYHTGENEYRYFIDFGEDAEGAARLFSKILHVVFNIPLNSRLKFETTEDPETKEEFKARLLLGSEEINAVDMESEKKQWYETWWGYALLAIGGMIIYFIVSNAD